MWNKRKKDDLPPRPEPAQTAVPGPAREAIPTSTYPSRRPDEAVTRGAALIGKSLVLSGKISGREDLVVDGRIEGDVELPENKLTVGAGGHVQGGVRAREVVVYGTVHGNMEAVEKVEIKRNARVLGDMRTARPVMRKKPTSRATSKPFGRKRPKVACSVRRRPKPPCSHLCQCHARADEARPGEPRKG